MKKTKVGGTRGGKCKHLTIAGSTNRNVYCVDCKKKLYLPTKAKRIEPIERIAVAHPLVPNAFIYQEVTNHQLWVKQCEIIEVINTILAKSDELI